MLNGSLNFQPQLKKFNASDELVAMLLFGAGYQWGLQWGNYPYC